MATLEDLLRQNEKKDLLRLLTCGSVDDGKSTLIGRLLHDSKLVYEDHLAALTRDSRRGAAGRDVDFSLLMDGLLAEREQGITIDVAYRYFSTPRRKFIIADTPGHVQYTRNMATGASTADLAVLLCDVRQGVLPQTRRHAFIASLLGIRHFLVAVNKMDLVDFDEAPFEAIRQDLSSFAARLELRDLKFIPISALEGDNVVEPSPRMPWYRGGPVVNYLETVHIASDRNLIDLRLPVQYVLRPDESFRGYCGTLASGILRRGDEIAVAPSGRRSRVASIVSFEGELEAAVPPMAVTITLEDELDVSRGDMLVRPNNQPSMDRSLEAMVIWMTDEPLRPGRGYLIKLGCNLAPVTVTDLRYRTNVSTLRREEADTLGLNEIGRVSLTTSRSCPHDPYAQNRATGCFVLIDRATNGTVGAGMIVRRRPGGDAEEGAQTARVSPAQRARLMGHGPAVVWISQSDDALLAPLERRLLESGVGPLVIDGPTQGFAVEALTAAARAATASGLVTLARHPLDAAQRAQVREAIDPIFVDEADPADATDTLMATLRARGVLS